MRQDLFNIEDFFTYHPPKSEEMKKKHAQVDKAALELARLVEKHILDPSMYRDFLNNIQYIRMMLNQSLTMEEIVKERHRK